MARMRVLAFIKDYRRKKVYTKRMLLTLLICISLFPFGAQADTEIVPSGIGSGAQASSGGAVSMFAALETGGTSSSGSGQTVIYTGFIGQLYFEEVKEEDVNGDGFVNILDLVLISIHFGRVVNDGLIPLWTSIGDGSIPDKADVNNDGVVNILDMVRVSIAFD